MIQVSPKGVPRNPVFRAYYDKCRAEGKNGQQVLEYLKQLTRQGKLVIVVTHNELVKQYADEVVEMKKGKVR